MPKPTKGCPNGAPERERDASWYDARYGLIPGLLSATWQERPEARWLWLPALALARGTILDLGCGPGFLAAICQHRGIPYAAGIDVSKRALARAAQMAPGLRFVRGRLPEALERLDVAYDTAVALEVLEHIYDDLGVLRAIPPGRRVVVSVPNFECEAHCRWFGSESEIRGRYGALIDIGTMSVHKVRHHAWWLFGATRKAA